MLVVKVLAKFSNIIGYPKIKQLAFTLRFFIEEYLRLAELLKPLGNLSVITNSQKEKTSVKTRK